MKKNILQFDLENFLPFGSGKSETCNLSTGGFINYNCKAVAIEFAPSNYQNINQMPKTNHICQLVSFAISTFVIMEEMASIKFDSSN